MARLLNNVVWRRPIRSDRRVTTSTTNRQAAPDAVKSAMKVNGCL